jgi:hypothetical protein
MAEASHLTQAHFHAFGHIISTYAKVEQGFKFIIAKIINVPRHVAVLLCEPYTTQSLRNVVSTVHTAYVVPDEIRERLIELVKQFEEFGKLRNAIGHNIWTEGTRADSIRPMRLDIRSGKPKYKGTDDAERDWTLQELQNEAHRLNGLHTDLCKLLDDFGPGHSFDQSGCPRTRSPRRRKLAG